MAQRKVFILYTGGTIGMVKTDYGFKPQPGYLSDYLHQHPALKNHTIPLFTIKEYSPLLDSANMQPQDWVSIARDIQAHYDDYDAFIVLHGTDTMAYTGAVLSFMLENLAKPVICTGAQIPMSELRNDAFKHVLDSLILLQELMIPEVCIYFDNVLLRANRTTKVDAAGMHAFDTPNFPSLAKFGTQLHIKQHLILPQPSKPLQLQLINKPMIAALQLFPGMSPDIVAAVLSQPINGLILSTYGSGNAPNNDPTLLKVLAQANERGVVIVNVTQCAKGSVDMGNYETGNALAQCGVISGKDMTLEAALTKLYYLFSKGYSLQDIKHHVPVNLRGELSA